MLKRPGKESSSSRVDCSKEKEKELEVMDRKLAESADKKAKKKTAVVTMKTLLKVSNASRKNLRR